MRAAKESPMNTTATSMRAIVQDVYGPAEVLGLETIDRPVIGAGDVLIEVAAAGLDRGVEHLMTGLPLLIRLMGYGLTKPKNRVLGLDVSGTVVGVGDDVKRFALGDEVFGIGNGSFAQYATADESKLAHKPASVTFEQAAVAAVSGITALQALTTVGELQPGGKVLIVGASGSVGSYAVQLAKALGGIVTGVASTPKVEFVRSLGADHIIDYTREDFADGSDRFDLILDIGGRSSVRRLRGVLAATGTLVIVGGEGGGKLAGGIGRQLRAMLLSPFIKQRLTTFMSKENHTFMESLAEYIERGEVTPAIGQQFKLDQVPEAMRQMAAGTLRGKSAIVIDERAPDEAS